jgi:hypothetical protein
VKIGKEDILPKICTFIFSFESDTFELMGVFSSSKPIFAIDFSALTAAYVINKFLFKSVNL